MNGNKKRENKRKTYYCSPTINSTATTMYRVQALGLALVQA
jgi:hypothetical protein